MYLRPLITSAVIFVSVLLTACTSAKQDPGPLAGTWSTGDFVAKNVKFRPGEVEEYGRVERADYVVEQDVVKMKYNTGPKSGIEVKFTFIDANTAKASAMYGFIRRQNNH